MKNIFLGIVLGLTISLAITSATAKITRFKTAEESKQMIEKHKAGLTLVKLDERLKKVEADQLKTKADIKKLKRDKLNAKTN